MVGGLERKAETFLIVEDDVTTVRCATQLLKERFTVVAAGCVHAAIEALAKLPRPAAVVIDGRLPDGRGATVVSRVHEMYPDIPMLVMTGYSDDHDLANLAQSISAEYAVKPGGSVLAFARRVVIREHLRDEILKRRADAVAASAGLSLCQTEVLALAVAGVSREKMAAVLGVSFETVKSHALQIGKRCGKPLGEVAWAIQAGERLAEPPPVGVSQGKAH